MQVNRILSLLLSGLMLFQSFSVAAEPFAHPEDELTLSQGWEPAPIDVSLGDFKLTVWFLQQQVGAPESGYLITRPDWIEMRRMLDHLEDEITRVTNKERKVCEGLLEQKDADCRELNVDLRKQIDGLNTNISDLNKDIGKLNDKIFWLKFGGITATVLAVSFGLFAISK